MRRSTVLSLYPQLVFPGRSDTPLVYHHIELIMSVKCFIVPAPELISHFDSKSEFYSKPDRLAIENNI
jgi:hypothetical protein